MLKLAAYQMQQTSNARSYKLCYYLLFRQKCSVTRQKVRRSLKIPSHYTIPGNRFFSGTFGKKLTQIEQLLSKTTFGECLCFGSAIKTVSIWFTKQINTFKNSQSYFVKQLFRKKKLEYYSENADDGVPLKQSQLQDKVIGARFRHFPLTFSTFSEQPFFRSHPKKFF